MKMIDHNHFICHLILGTFTEYPYLSLNTPKRGTQGIGRYLKFRASFYVWTDTSVTIRIRYVSSILCPTCWLSAGGCS